jgi:hypothetical protein
MPKYGQCYVITYMNNKLLLVTWSKRPDLGQSRFTEVKLKSSGGYRVLVDCCITSWTPKGCSRTGLSSPREKRWPITALELPEVNKPQARISGGGFQFFFNTFKYLHRGHFRYVCTYDLDSCQLEFKNNLFGDNVPSDDSNTFHCLR